MNDTAIDRLLPLYPTIEARASGRLALDPVHNMYWEESGTPTGIPVVFLHGGPGGGSSPRHRRFFDPEAYRILVYDQRGAGLSTPLGELRDNTTAHLVADLERLRTHLGVERWLVFGGSWGSTLALAYAEAHPHRCLGLVLRGVFLCRPAEIEWFLYGLRHVFPEAWDRFAGYLPAGERGDLLESYHRRLVDPDPAVHLPAAKRWSAYEGSCSTLLRSRDERSADPRLPGGVSSIGYDHIARLGPRFVQLVGGNDRADHVVAPLHDHTGDVADAIHLLEQGVGRHEDAVAEVMRLDACEAERDDVVLEMPDDVLACDRFRTSGRP
jgi:proline iminopeptidase